MPVSGVEIGTAYLTIEASARGAVRQIQRDFGDSMPAVGKKAGAQIGGGVLAGAKSVAGPLAAFFAVDKIKDFFTSAVGGASDLNETVNKSDTIFGKNAGAINKWAQGSEKALGLTHQQAIDAAASFGDMFVQIGFTGDAAAKMSKSTVQMAADLGSFNNLPTADVQERISAAFRGEYDSLQKVIPNISAARVEQVALATTGKKTTKELTAQDKAAAVLAIVHKDGARATGDFAKTQGGLANQSKIAKAQLSDLATKVGTSLLPIINKFFNFLTSKGIPALTKFVDYLQKNAPGAFAKVKSALDPVIKTIKDSLPPIKSVLQFIKDNSTVFGALAVGIGTIVAALKVWAAVTKTMAIVQAALNLVLSANPIGIVVLAVAGLAAGLVYAYKHSKTFRNVVHTAFQAVKKVVQSVVNWFKDNLVPFFTKKIPNAFHAVIAWVKKNWPLILALLTGPIGLAVLAIVKHRDKIMDALKHAVTWVKTTFKTAWNGIKAILEGPVNLAKQGFDKLLGPNGSIRNVFSKAVKAIGSIWSGLQALAKKPVSFIINTVLNDGLISAFNAIAKVLPGVGPIDKISIPGFASGGWTGPGPKYQPAGVVHADEFVINKESRRKIEAANPGYLDKLNGYARGGRVVWPVPGHQTGTYPGHDGVDINRGSGWDDFGDPIRAAMGGRVSYVGAGHGYGEAIFIKTSAGPTNIYGHTSKRYVHAGQNVNTGQLIGAVGNTGHSSAPHLHFGVRPGLTTSAALAFLHGAIGQPDGGGGTGGGPDGGLGFLNLLSDLKKKVSGSLGKLSQLGSSPFAQLVASVPKAIAKGMLAKGKSLIGDVGSKVKGVAGVARWAPMVALALKMNKLPLTLTDNWLRQIKSESGGNPKAVQGNIGDVNNRSGDLAKGLVQVIGATFAAYRSKALPNDRFNPLSNLYAGMNYAKHRYHDLEAVIGHGHGYAKGTESALPGWALVGERGPELRKLRAGDTIKNASDTARMLSNPRAGLVINGGVHGLNAADVAFEIEKNRRRDEALHPIFA